MVVASTVRTELACSQLDIGALTTFREEWFETRPTEQDKTGSESSASGRLPASRRRAY
jgi:hypothetical protein